MVVIQEFVESKLLDTGDTFFSTLGKGVWLIFSSENHSTFSFTQPVQINKHDFVNFC